MSIVIPTFDDAPAYLVESVGSALAQDYGRVEVIVVNDGSTRHDTLAHLAELEARGDVLVLHQPNGGVAGALNTGIRASSGEYILVLGADDRLSTDVVSQGVSALRPGVLASFPSLERFTDEGASWAVDIPSVVALSDIILWNTVAASAVFRRADFDKVGGYRSDLPGPEDWWLWLDMFLDAGGVMRRTGGTLYYRDRPGSRNKTLPGSSASWRLAYFRARPEHQETLYLAMAEHAEQLRVRSVRQASALSVWQRRFGWTAGPLSVARQLRQRTDRTRTMLRARLQHQR